MRLLWSVMTADVDRVYTDAKMDEFEDRFTMELVRLHTRGPMTISELAESVERALFTVTRKVGDMEAAGLVTTTPSADGRDKVVAVTTKTMRLVDRLMAEWEATEAAIAEVEAETPYPLSRAFADLEKALERKSFYDRVREKLAENANWTTVN
jgi:DNA-binding MarR family transcriptional regulator